MERIQPGWETIVFVPEGFCVLIAQIAADEQLLVNRQFQSGTVEKRAGEFVAEIEEMRTAAKNGIKQLVLEAGREIRFVALPPKNIICTLVFGLALTSPNWKPSSFSL